MTNLIKICSECGNKNSLEKQICNCGAPLFMVIPTADNDKNDIRETDELVENDIIHNEPRKYRKCKVCGTINYLENGRDVRKCKNPNCSNDELYRSRIETEKEDCSKSNVSDYEDMVSVTPLNSNDNMLQLRSRNSDKIIRIKRDVVIGRMGDIETDYFSNYDKVSRRHCSVCCVNGQWYVKDLKSSNCTYVNGVPLNSDEETMLSDGDVLSIWKLHFEVKLGGDE